MAGFFSEILNSLSSDLELFKSTFENETMLSLLQVTHLSGGWVNINCCKCLNLTCLLIAAFLFTLVECGFFFSFNTSDV